MSSGAWTRGRIASHGGATEDAPRINNVGWRIDYQFSTPAIASTAKETDIYRDERFSDHAPLTVVYDFNLQ